jgi:hypothetical protein
VLNSRVICCLTPEQARSRPQIPAPGTDIYRENELFSVITRPAPAAAVFAHLNIAPNENHLGQPLQMTRWKAEICKLRGLHWREF